MCRTAPLLDRPAEAALFQRPQGPVTAAAFLADARALAAALPPGSYLINLCRDRYAFAVGFAAGLLAGRTALLNVDPGGLAGVAAAYAGCTVVADDGVACALPVTRVVAAGFPPADFVVPEIACDHLAAIVFTSGSTGAPVPHPKRWGGLVQRSLAAVAPFGLAGGTIVGTVPPQHMYGFELTVLLPLHAPVGSWCGPAFFPGDVAAASLACPAPRLLVTTPLQLRALLQGGMRLPLAGVVSATAPLDPALAAEAEAAWDAPVQEIFGATECGSIASRRTTAGPDWTLYPGVELGGVKLGGVSLADQDAGAVVEAPWMDKVMLADVLERTATGFRLLGRRTDLVKLGGRRASLPGLNQALTGLAGVEDGAFVVPDDLDERSTARLVAVVVAPKRTGQAILAELRLVLDPVFVPRRVIRVERLPRNALGKLPREALLRIVAEAAVPGTGTGAA